MGRNKGDSGAMNQAPATSDSASARRNVAPSGGKGGETKSKKASARAVRHHITPEEALDNTRNLLAAKQLRARQAPPWQAHDTQSTGHVPDAGFESAGARDRAAELHDGEMRLDANKGSISAQDRHQQGKRDNR